MFKVNPYRPGAGLMPVYIAGRDEDIQNVSQMFDALTMDKGWRVFSQSAYI